MKKIILTVCTLLTASPALAQEYWYRTRSAAERIEMHREAQANPKSTASLQKQLHKAMTSVSPDVRLSGTDTFIPDVASFAVEGSACVSTITTFTRAFKTSGMSYPASTRVKAIDWSQVTGISVRGTIVDRREMPADRIVIHIPTGDVIYQSETPEGSDRISSAMWNLQVACWR